MQPLQVVSTLVAFIVKNMERLGSRFLLREIVTALLIQQQLDLRRYQSLNVIPSTLDFLYMPIKQPPMWVSRIFQKIERVVA